jgi:hypothetical protein
MVGLKGTGKTNMSAKKDINYLWYLKRVEHLREIILYFGANSSHNETNKHIMICWYLLFKLKIVF